MAKGIKAFIIAFCITFTAAVIVYAAADHVRNEYNACLDKGGTIEQTRGVKGKSWHCVQAP